MVLWVLALTHVFAGSYSPGYYLRFHLSGVGSDPSKLITRTLMDGSIRYQCRLTNRVPGNATGYFEYYNSGQQQVVVGGNISGGTASLSPNNNAVVDGRIRMGGTNFSCTPLNPLDMEINSIETNKTYVFTLVDSGSSLYNSCLDSQMAFAVNEINHTNALVALGTLTASNSDAIAYFDSNCTAEDSGSNEELWFIWSKDDWVTTNLWEVEDIDADVTMELVLGEDVEWGDYVEWFVVTTASTDSNTMRGSTSSALNYRALAIERDMGDPHLVGMLKNASFEVAGTEYYAENWAYNQPDSHGGVSGGAQRRNWVPRKHGGYIMSLNGWSVSDSSVWQETPNVYDGASWHCSVWTYNQPAYTCTRPELRIEFRDESSTVLDAVTNVFTLGGASWQQVEVDGIAPQGTEWVRAVVAANGQGSSDALRIEDVVLYYGAKSRHVWDGGAGASDMTFTNATNWDGDERPEELGWLYFSGSTGLYPTNDYPAATRWEKLFFTNTSSSFTLRGNDYTVLSSIENESTVLQTVDSDLHLSGTDHTAVHPDKGDLVLNGDVYLDGDVVLDVYGDNGNTVVLNGVVQEGSGSSAGGCVWVRENSTLILSNNNTWIGDTLVTGGELVLGVDDAVHDSSDVIVSNTGTFSLDGYDDEVASIEGDGTVELGAGTLRVSGSVDRDFSGTVSGSGDLIYSASGTWSVDGTWAFSGAVSLTGGTMVVDGDVDAASLLTVYASSSALEGEGSLPATTVWGIVKPGNGTATDVGTLTMESVVLEDGGTLEVDFGDVSGTAGTDWDLVDADAGSIAVDASSGDKFTILFKDDNIANWNAQLSYSWVIVSGTSVSGFDAAEFALDVTDWPAYTGTFSVESADGDLVVTYAGAPECRNVGGGAVGRQARIYQGDTGCVFSADSTASYLSENARARLWLDTDADVSDGMAGAWTDIVTVDSKSVTSAVFSTTGTRYWGIQLDYGATYGTNFWYTFDSSAWTDVSPDGTSSLSFVVMDIGDPTGVSADAGAGDPYTEIDVSWTLWDDSGQTDDRPVLVVRSTDATVGVPVNGVSYAVNDTIDGDTVIYSGSATGVTDDGRVVATTYYYGLYTCNNDYYSAGEVVFGQTDGYSLTAPTDCYVVNDGPETMRLFWTKQAGAYDTIIVRRLGGEPAAPQNGTAYTAGDVFGGDTTVVYIGDDQSVTNFGLVPSGGQDYYYGFYTAETSVNQYSSAGTVKSGDYTLHEATPTFPANVIIDSFAYDPVWIKDQAGGSGWGGSWSNLDAGAIWGATNVNLSGAPGSAEPHGNALWLNPLQSWSAAIRQFSTPFNSGTIYLGYRVRIDNAFTTNCYFGLDLCTGTNQVLHYGTAANTDGLALQFMNFAGTGWASKNNQDPITHQATYTICGKYEFATGLMSIKKYVGYPVAPVEPEWDLQYTDTVMRASLSGVLLKAGGRSGQDLRNVYFDEVVVATNWTEMVWSSSMQMWTGSTASAAADYTDASNWREQVVPSNGISVVFSEIDQASRRFVTNDLATGELISYISFVEDNHSMVMRGSTYEVQHGIDSFSTNEHQFDAAVELYGRGSAAQIGSSAGDVIFNSTVSINSNAELRVTGQSENTIRFNGAIQPGTYGGGGEKLVLAGNHTVDVTGVVNTFAGGTVIGEGNLLVDDDRCFGAEPGSSDADNIVLRSNGMLRVDGAISLTLHANRGVQLGTGSGRMFADEGASLTVPATVTADGGGLRKLGGGALIVESTMTCGDTLIVESGTVSVAGISSSSGLIVSNAAAFIGPGIVGNCDLRGEVGSSYNDVPGLLEADDVQFRDGASYRYGIKAGSNDLIDASGTVTFDGEVILNIDDFGGGSLYADQVIIDYTGGSSVGSPTWVITGDVSEALSALVTVTNDRGSYWYIPAARPTCDIADGETAVGSSDRVTLSIDVQEGISYDLLYVEVDTYNDSLSNAWQYADTLVASSSSLTFTSDVSTLVTTTMRFLRVAPSGAWSNTAERYASEQIYVVKKIELSPGRNWVALPCIPDSATISNVFGYDLPSAPSSVGATSVQLYNSGRNMTATNVMWLGNDQHWYSGVTPVDNDELPFEQGLFVDLPGISTQSFTVVGRLRTNRQTVALQGSDAMNFVSVFLPGNMHPSELNLLASGFQGNRRASRSDRIYLWDRSTQGLKDSQWIWYNTRVNKWCYGDGSVVQDSAKPIAPDDGMIIYCASTTADWTWTNQIYYTPPTKYMSP